MKTLLYISLYFCFFNLSAYAGVNDTLPDQTENDTVPFELFRNRVVAYADLGVHSAPFSIKDDYIGTSRLTYRNNLKMVLGFGFAYKWLAFRLGVALPGNILSAAKYTNTRYFDLGLRFNIKKAYCSIDFRNYQGYGIKDAYKWDTTLTQATPNRLMKGVRSSSLSANMWYFKDAKFNMKAALGKVGHFTGEAKTWYFKASLNLFGVRNSQGSLAPAQITDSSERSNAESIGAIDIGFIPGYVYANRINNWQFSVFTGLGGVIQAKYFIREDVSRSFLGIAPRLDFRLIGGYSKPNYFILLSGDFDIKSVKIQQTQYNQSYFNIRLTGGFRFQTKQSREDEGRI